MLQCKNCEKTITPLFKRFPLCECMHIEAYDTEKGTYAEIIWHADAVKLVSASGYEKYISAPENIRELLKEIVGLPVKNGKEVVKCIAAYTQGDERNFIVSLPTWAAVAHYFHKKYSKQYMYVIRNKYFPFATEILKSGTYFDYSQPEALSKITHLMQIWNKVPAEAAVIVYEALLFGYSEEESCKLGFANIRAPELIEFISKVPFNRSDVINYMYSLSQRRYSKPEIFDMLTEYSKALDYMDQCGYDFNPPMGLSADVLIHYAVDDARYCKRENIKLKTQLATMYKICGSLNSGIFYKSHDIMLFPASLKDAVHFTACIPENEAMQVLPLTVMNSNRPLGILYIAQKEIYGVWFKFLTDEMKKDINICLDMYSNSSQYKRISEMIMKMR